MSSSSAPAILCAGIAVQDIVFRVEQFPQPGGKCMTNEFIVVSGGCAVNAAIAVARLGGRARYAGPLGDTGDNVSNQLMAEMAREGIDTSGVVRVAGATAPVSGIMVDAAGERMIVTHRDKRIETAQHRRSRPAGRGCWRCCSPTTAFPSWCGRCARRRGGAAFPSCSTPTGRPSRTIRCFAISDPRDLLRRMPARHHGARRLSRRPAAHGAAHQAFLAVSDGPGPVRYLAEGAVRTLPVFKIEAVDTLAAGDVFHAGIALALAEGRDAVSAMRFGAAAAGLKCTRFGGSMGAPSAPRSRRSWRGRAELFFVLWCYQVVPRGQPAWANRPGHHPSAANGRPSQAEAEDAVRALLRWAGESPAREGLLGAPGRVARAYGNSTPVTVGSRRVWSAPRETGRLRRDGGAARHPVRKGLRASHGAGDRQRPVAYLPSSRVVGISKFARVVEGYRRRLQIQEKMTVEIGKAGIKEVLKPNGVAVVIEAEHGCMTRRGVHNPRRRVDTSGMLGAFRVQRQTRDEFLSSLNLRGRPRAV